MLATGCVVIAASSQFHGSTDDVRSKVDFGDGTEAEVKAYHGYIDERLQQTDPNLDFSTLSDDELETLRVTLPEADKIGSDVGKTG